MKSEILDYFKKDRSHSAGVVLIIKHSNRLALKKQVNIHPESEYMTGVIQEELRELAGITKDDLKDILSVPVQKDHPKFRVEETPVDQAPAEPESPEANQAPVRKKDITLTEVKKVSRKK